MKLPQIILVPTDFSAAAESALDYALGLASKLDARVYLLHAYELPMVGFPDGMLVASAEIASHIISDAEKHLAAAVAKRKQTAVALTPILKQADPRQAILTAAEDLNADLVVMGTHGRRGIARALIGSVAEAVVRVCPVPVLTVRAAT